VGVPGLTAGGKKETRRWGVAMDPWEKLPKTTRETTDREKVNHTDRNEEQGSLNTSEEVFERAAHMVAIVLQGNYAGRGKSGV